MILENGFAALYPLHTNQFMLLNVPLRSRKSTQNRAPGKGTSRIALIRPARVAVEEAYLRIVGRGPWINKNTVLGSIPLGVRAL